MCPKRCMDVVNGMGIEHFIDTWWNTVPQSWVVPPVLVTLICHYGRGTTHHNSRGLESHSTHSRVKPSGDSESTVTPLSFTTRKSGYGYASGDSVDSLPELTESIRNSFFEAPWWDNVPWSRKRKSMLKHTAQFVGPFFRFGWVGPVGEGFFFAWAIIST